MIKFSCVLKKVTFSLLLLYLFFTKNIFAEFSEHQNGIIDEIQQSDIESKTIYLTLDACGGKHGSIPDKKLIKFLIKNGIKTTLFINKRFLEKNSDYIKQIYNTGYFSIQNHGSNHIPASVDGKTIYGIKGTDSLEELYSEIMLCDDFVKKTLGVKMNWFRSGTAYYDTEAIEFINKLGYKIAGFSITADEGATLNAKKVKEKTLQAKSGFIILAHMNHPESGTREGLIDAIKILIKRGYNFEFLPD